MDAPLSRRGLLQAMAAAPVVLPLTASEVSAGPLHRPLPGHVSGRLTGAQAVVDTLIAEGTACVFGIPGAQENELWDAMKARGLPYLLTTHEFSAACMADACGRVTGRPGVLCVVPGPGVTNSLSGLGEALLDSSPVVAIVGDVGRGEDYRPFQVHCLDNVALLKPVTKAVYAVEKVEEIPCAIRKAFALALAGEPGPVAVVIPYTLLIDVAAIHSPPLPPCPLPFDEAAFQHAVALLGDRRLKVGIYAGVGCMNAGPELAAVAELLQAPVATSVSGKGVISEFHPLAVGWGYGPQASPTAEAIFAGGRLHGHGPGVDCILAIGVRYSEVSTGFYSNPRPKKLIHVDANACNLGQVLKPDVAVHADAGLFLSRLLAEADRVRRAPDAALAERIHRLKCDEDRAHRQTYSTCGVDPMALVLALRRSLPTNGLFFVDVTVSEHLAAEAYRVVQPRTYFNPTDNQAMGWSIPAAIGAQRLFPHCPVATLTGDGCFLFSMVEISTAAREGLPVKFFVLDDQAYHYMQLLQKPAYLRTTATILTRLDYPALAKGFGVGYMEAAANDQLDGVVRGAMATPGPVLVRVVTDYGKRPFRWLDAVRAKYTEELSARQKARFLARIGSRAVTHADKTSD